MNQIETSIIINTSQIDVWNTLTNFKEYPKWNPFITEISGDLEKGNTLQVQINPPENSSMKFTPKVLSYTPTIEFSWLGALFFPGIFDGNHYFKLRAISGSQTQLTHGERFSGIFASLLLRLIGKNTQLGFEQMNLALKNHLEQKL